MSDSATIDGDTALPGHGRQHSAVAPGFRVNIVYSDGEPVVVVRGDVDYFSAPRMGDAIDAVLQRGHRRVVVELSKVTFMDTAAVEVLAGARQRFAARGGAVRFRGAGALGRRVLDLYGLSGPDGA